MDRSEAFKNAMERWSKMSKLWFTEFDPQRHVIITGVSKPGYSNSYIGVDGKLHSETEEINERTIDDI